MLSVHAALNLVENDAMSGINSIEHLQNIRWGHGNLPVILMTTYGERDFVLDALNNQCNSFIELIGINSQL
jgi:hypothetical protein